MQNPIYLFLILDPIKSTWEGPPLLVAPDPTSSFFAFPRHAKNDEMQRTLTKYGEICRGNGGIWRNISEVWRNMVRHQRNTAKFGGKLRNFGGIWRKRAKFGGIWRNLAEFGEIFLKSKNYEMLRNLRKMTKYGEICR